jgi:hypothetical protein
VLQVIGQQLSLACATPAHPRRRRRARRAHPSLSTE